jgi:hypothetical protein
MLDGIYLAQYYSRDLPNIATNTKQLYYSKFGEFLLPFGSETLVIPPAVQECKR